MPSQGCFPRYNHIKTSYKIAQNGSQRLVWYTLVCLMPCFSLLWCLMTCLGRLWVSCLVSSGWLWYVSWCAMVILWYVSLLSSGYALACLGCLMVCLGWLWYMFSIYLLLSHGWLCPDDVLCKNRPCSKFTLWILSIHVNLKLIYVFIYTC